MPCMDGREYEDRIRLDTIRQILTRFACEELTHKENTGQPIPDYIRAWWEEHKIYDQQMGRRP